MKQAVRKSKVRHYEKICKRCSILKVLPSMKIWGYSSAGRAPALQAGGQRFDPAYLHQSSRGTGLQNEA